MWLIVFFNWYIWKKSVVIKGMLQSPRLKYHTKNIGIYQSLIKSDFLNTDILKTPRNYTNMLGSVTNSNNSKIFLRPIWFIILKDSLITVPYLSRPHQHSRNKVLENHCVFSQKYFMWKTKLQSVKSELLN